MSFTNPETTDPKYLNTINFTIPDVFESYQKAKQINDDILAVSNQKLEIFCTRAFPKICTYIHEAHQKAVKAGLLELTLQVGIIARALLADPYKDYITEIKYIYNLHDPITYRSEKIDYICKIKFEKYICDHVLELYRSKGYKANFRDSIGIDNQVSYWFTISWDK